MEGVLIFPFLLIHWILIPRCVAGDVGVGVSCGYEETFNPSQTNQL